MTANMRHLSTITSAALTVIIMQCASVKPAIAQASFEGNKNTPKSRLLVTDTQHSSNAGFARLRTGQYMSGIERDLKPDTRYFLNGSIPIEKTSFIIHSYKYPSSHESLKIKNKRSNNVLHLARNISSEDADELVISAKSKLAKKVNKDQKPSAVDDLRIAEKKGSAEANWLLSDIYQNGVDIKKDIKKAKKFRKEALKKSYFPPPLPIYEQRVTRRKLLENSRNRVNELQIKAGQGDVVSAMTLSDVFLQKGDQKSLEEAEQLYKTFAEFNNATALARLGLLYVRNSGGHFPNLEKEGIASFEQSAVRGSADGAAFLGWHLLQSQDPAIRKRGLFWLRRAAERSHGLAVKFLAHAYRNGIGVKADSTVAANLFYVAADLGELAAREEARTVHRELCKEEQCFTRKVLVITNRKINPDKPKTLFDDYLDTSLLSTNENIPKNPYRLGVSTVKVYTDKLVEELLNARGVVRKKYVPEKLSGDNLLGTEIVQQDRFWEKNTTGFDKDESTLIFIHGFNNDFEEAMRRISLFAYRIGFEGNLILFSWPSGLGGFRGYGLDEDVMRLSCHVLQTALVDLLGKSGVSDHSKTTLLAHSMGSRLLVLALTNCPLIPGPQVKLEFGNIIFAAPDVDPMTFKVLFEDIRNNAKRLTLYAHDGDNALTARSSLLQAGQPRLGHGGDDLVILGGLDSLDASNLWADSSYHAYVFQASSVLADVSELILQSLGPDRRSKGGLKKQTTPLPQALPYWVF